MTQPPDSERPAPPVALPRREAPSTEVTRHLVDYLLSGALSAGQRIPSERELAKALDVGRSGVREAIKSLSLLGLLDVRQGAGTYLTSSPSNLLPRVIEWGLLLGEPRVYHLMEVRSHLEVDSAGLAASRRDDRAVARLNELVERMRAADTDIDAYVNADIEFHLAIAEATGNEVMANLVRSIQSLLRVWAARVLQSAGETASSLEMHVPIVEAIERKDVDAAREAMAAHMERAYARLRATLDTLEGAEVS
jgi:GntR family transcriptional regulator, transcriptional repressor for pyruvate dehydrogenase complex